MVSSRCSWIVTVLPANVFRNRVLSICQDRSRMATVFILLHHTLRLRREDPIQVASCRPSKGRASLRGRHTEPSVELLDVPLPQKGIGTLYSGDPATRSSCGNRPCQVPKLRSDRPRACGEYAAIICTPNSFIARPTCVRRCLSTFSPSFTVTKKWLPRSLYKAQNKPWLSITSRTP